MRLPDRNEESDLDRDFPLGDGTADIDATVQCPYCASPVEIALDPGSGNEQEYIEDCEVCCQPWQVTVRYAKDGHADVIISVLEE